MFLYHFLYGILLLVSCLNGAAERYVVDTAQCVGHQFYHDTPILVEQPQNLSLSYMRIPSQKDMENIMAACIQHTVNKPGMVSPLEDTYPESERARDFKIMIDTFQEVKKGTDLLMSSSKKLLSKIEKFKRNQVAHNLGINFIAFTERFNLLLENKYIQYAPDGTGNVKDGILEADYQTPNMINLFDTWFNLNNVVLSVLETEGLLSLQHAVGKASFRHPNSLGETEKFNLGYLKISRGWVPFVMERSLPFAAQGLHLYQSDIKKDGFLVVFHKQGDLFEADGLSIEEMSQGIRISLVTGSCHKTPLRRTILCKSNSVQIDDSLWAQLPYIVALVFGFKMGFMPFYENEIEQKYMQLAYYEIARDFYITHQVDAPEVAECLAITDESGRIEERSASSSHASSSLVDTSIDLHAPVQKEIETAINDLQAELIQQEQERCREAVARGEIQGKSKAAHTKKKQGLKAKGKNKSQNKKNEQAKRQAQEKELLQKAAAIVEEHMQKSRLKLRTLMKIFGEVKKEVQEVSEEYGIPLEEGTLNTAGSHHVLHTEHGPVTFVTPHGTGRDGEVSAQRANDLVKEYVDVMLLKNIRKHLFD
jgi:hypothetical protein